MRFATLSILALSGFTTACASYTMPAPGNFTPAASLEVTGASGFKQKEMTVGDYQIAINRASTQDRTQGAESVTAARKFQNYNFVMRKSGTTTFTGGCTLEARETSVGGPGGILITASDNASLSCELLPNGTGRDSWKLELRGEVDRPLNGTLSHANERYELEGVGVAIGSTKHGPTGGYYIKQNDRTLATVQTTAPRSVKFAEGAQSEALVAVAVVLLLSDGVIE